MENEKYSNYPLSISAILGLSQRHCYSRNTATFCMEENASERLN